MAKKKVPTKRKKPIKTKKTVSVKKITEHELLELEHATKTFLEFSLMYAQALNGSEGVKAIKKHSLGIARAVDKLTAEARKVVA